MKRRNEPDDTPAAPRKTPAAGAPRASAGKREPRVSSPVEIAAGLREAPPSQDASAIAAPSTGGPAADTSSAPPPAARQEIEEYAVVLHRRLQAGAPVIDDEDGEFLIDSRPLRDRVRERHGLAALLMFRIGHEFFAADLASVEEAVELPAIHRLPEMPAAMLGAFDLRGRLTPVYSPAHVIGVPLAGIGSAALLVRANGHRIGLAVDDVEDVLQVDLAAVREAPGIDASDGVLLGVAHHGERLVALLDAESLVAGCVNGIETESA